MVLAIICGVLFLLFDAARYFAQQLGAVRLRRLTGDPQVEKHGWTRYDAENFNLVSGALLQAALIAAMGSTALAMREYPLTRAIGLSVVVWTFIVLAWKFILALVPDVVAEMALRFLIPVSHVFFYLFFPVLFPLRKLVERIDRDAEADEQYEEPSDAEVQAYIDVGEEEGILEETEGKLVQQIVEFGNRLARELMTPRIDMVAFDAKRPLAELALLFSETKYSRIPIYQNSVDAITGIVHLKDLFDAVLKGEPRSVAELARPPYFVAESKKAKELLHEFQTEHIQVAVVVDEFGGTAGIITIEDIVEDILGDISDEHEDQEETIAAIGENDYVVSGQVPIDRLEEMLGADLHGEDYETVAGLIFTTLGRVPSTGTRVSKSGFRFTVERADRRRIYRVRVTKDPEWQPEEEVDAE
jgi:CBS domain containing-hemolysin-like protein